MTPISDDDLIARLENPDLWQKDELEYIDPLCKEAAARLRSLFKALTPSAETKATYIGEFHFDIESLNEDGEECQRRVTVPWTTIKEIMAAISANGAGK